jgi:hypothetical protein
MKTFKLLKKYLIVLVLSCLMNLFNTSFSYAAKLRFLLIGHTYPLIDKGNEILVSEIYKKINNEKVDSVFFLGGNYISKKDVYLKIIHEINHKIYFLPSYNETSNFNKFKENVNYLYKEINFDNFKILLVPGNDNLNNINSFLEKNKNIDLDKKKFIFTTERIWDDSVLSDEVFGHRKSYKYNDIRENLINNIEAVFSGSGKRYYFSDLTQQDNYGKQNVNIIYWVDLIDGIEFYNIGNGDAYPNVGYVILEIDSLTAEYKLIAKKIELDKDYELLDGKNYNLSFYERKNMKEKIFFLFISKKFYAGIIFTLFLIFMSRFLIKKLIKND